MPHLIKNKNLEILIDLPEEHYNFSRFDWTGKITEVKFQNKPVTTIEQIDGENQHQLGKGFYNEFGIETAVGFDEAPAGGWFHKIGVGLLKKEDEQYLFSKKYKIKPAKFEYTLTPKSIIIRCISEYCNGYAYILEKKIGLHQSGFTINYMLQNTGYKSIITDEYVHNFIALNKMPSGRDYVLKFPFDLKPGASGKIVNPDHIVEIGQNEVKFNGAPDVPFFYSQLSGDLEVRAKWELKHLKNALLISETGSFLTKKVNLWGCMHVISPELFFDISLSSGQSANWSRRYSIDSF